MRFTSAATDISTVSTAYSNPAADPQFPDGTDFGAPSTSTVTGWTGSASSSYGYDPAAGFPTGGYILPPANFDKVRIAHAVIMSCAVLILFPAGGIIIRVLNHDHIVWIHAAFQMTAWVFYVAGAGMGIYLARSIFQVCLAATLPSPLRSTSLHTRSQKRQLTNIPPTRPAASTPSSASSSSASSPSSPYPKP